MRLAGAGELIRRIAGIAAVALALLAATAGSALASETTITYHADGNPNDVSGTHDGTWSGPPSYATPGSTLAPGDQAFSFNGSSSNYLTFDQAAGTFGTDDATISFEIQTTSTASHMQLMGARASCDNPSAGWWELAMGGTGVGRRISVEFGGVTGGVNTYSALVGSRTVNDGLWHQVVVHRTSSGLSITIDGTLDASGSAPVSNVNPSVPFEINNSPCLGTNGDVPVTANIDEINISRGDPPLSVTAPSSDTVGSSIAPASVPSTLSGAASPTGTITWKVLGPSSSAPTDCSGGTPVGTASVSGNGTYNPSSGYTPSSPGDYWWYTSYSGDADNNGANSGCGGSGMTETVVGQASPSISTSQQPASATVGSSIADQATVSGGDSPSGTVTFNLYNNPNGTGTPLFTDANEPLSGGTATSKGYTTTATGTDYWVATYNGDNNNTSVSSGGSSEPVSVSAASPGISVSAPSAGTSGSAISSSSISASLSGGSSPTGTITFKVFGPQSSAPTDCSGGTTVGTATASGDGTYNPSSGYTPSSAGNYWWYASYGGDSNNNSANSGCGSGMTETTVGQASPGVSVSAPSSGTTGRAISSSSISASLSGGDSPTGTITFKVFGPESSAPTDCSGGTTVGTATVSGDGTYNPSSGFTPSTAGDYWWYASYSGDSNNNPENSGCGSGMIKTTVSQAPPASSAPPTISGTAQQGQTLTESHGKWSNSPTAYTYQWEDCDSQGNSCTAISGATAQTYTLQSADVSHTIRVVETASNSGGSGQATSGHTGVVTAPSPSDLHISTSGPVTRSGSTVNPGITLSCPANGPTCSATEQATVLIGAPDTPAGAQPAHPITVGSASFTIPAGSSTQAVFQVNQLGMELLSDHRELPLQLQVSGQAQGQSPVSATKAITLSGQFAHYTVTSVKAARNGTVTVHVKVSAPGRINVLVSAWKDNIAGAARMLNPAPRRLVVGRASASSTRAGTLTLHVHPTPHGRQLITHPAYPVTLRVWVSYIPLYAYQIDTGYYGLHTGGTCPTCHKRTWP